MNLYTPRSIDQKHVSGPDLVDETTVAANYPGNFDFLEPEQIERIAPPSRPAENTAGGFAAAAVISMITGAPEPVSIALVAGAGVAPHLVSLLIDHGGIRGVARLIWRGRQ